MFMLLLYAETDIADTRNINTANSCICHHGKDGCFVDRVHGFGIIRHVHSNRKDGSGVRMLVVASHIHESYAESNMKNQYSQIPSTSSCLRVLRPHSLPDETFLASLSLSLFPSCLQRRFSTVLD